jgi:hypothetical protein
MARRAELFRQMDADGSGEPSFAVNNHHCS